MRFRSAFSLHFSASGQGPCRRVLAPFALTLALGLAGAAGAQEALPSDPQQDRAELDRRAAGDTELAAVMLRLVERVAINTGRAMAREEMTSWMGTRDMLQGQAFAYREAPIRQEAEIRARLIGNALIADLNGDWQISREELTSVLRASSDRGLADLFVLGDVNGDNVLDTEELKAVAAAQAKGRGAGRGNERGHRIARLFDFDNDGVLTIEELDRAIAALTPQQAGEGGEGPGEAPG